MTVQECIERVSFWKKAVSVDCSVFKKRPCQDALDELVRASAQLVFETQQLREAKSQARRTPK